VLDAIGFEKRGIPAAAIVTAPFVPTADAMARLSGMPGYAYAVVAHPIGSLAPADLAARAEGIAARIESLLME
jgi:hypothetical protein